MLNYKTGTSTQLIHTIYLNLNFGLLLLLFVVDIAITVDVVAFVVYVDVDDDFVGNYNSDVEKTNKC